MVQKNKFLVYSFFITLFINSGLNAQTFDNNYIPLISGGAFPATVIAELQTVVDAELKDRNNGKMQFAERNKIDSVIEQDIFLKHFLLSGEVLYNDSLGIYVSHVADEVLRNDPQLRNKIHFYVTNSSKVNTISFSRGFVFVSTGLIAQLENEAQLAFFLANGISHIKRNHRQNYFSTMTLSENSSNQFNYSDCLESTSRYSRVQEMEADADAAVMIKNSEYSISQIDNAYNLLQYDYLSIEDAPFERSFFEEENLKLADTLFLKKTIPILSSDDRNYFNSHDPIIRDRRNKLENSFNIFEDEGRKKYIQPRALFLRIREIARFELCSDYFLKQEYANAFYTATILLKKYPENIYLKKIIVKALYGLSIIKTKEFRNPIPAYMDVPDQYQMDPVERYSIYYTSAEGKIEALYYFLENIKASELNVLAIRYGWNAYKQSNDPEFRPLVDSLFRELFIVNKMRNNDFSRYNRTELKTMDSLREYSAKNKDDEENDSKYAKIKALQLKNDIDAQDNFMKYVFVDLFKDKEFEKAFDADYNLSYKHRGIQEVDFRHDDRVMLDLSKLSVKIPKVVFVNPSFDFYNKRSNNWTFDLSRIGSQQTPFLELLKRNLTLFSINYEFLQNTTLSETDIGLYNDLAILHRWITEKEKNGNNPDAVVLSVNVQKLTEKYGTRYFAFMSDKALTYNGGKTFHTCRVYDIISGELVQFDLKMVDFIAHSGELFIPIDNSIKELQKRK